MKIDEQSMKSTKGLSPRWKYLDTLSNLNHSEITKWLINCPRKSSIELLIKSLAELC